MFGLVSACLTRPGSLQDPNTQKVQKNAIYKYKREDAYVQGNHFYQATKRHLNNSSMVNLVLES